MPIRGVNKVRNRINRSLQNVSAKTVERSLTAIGATVLGRADQYAPIDTKALINSGFRTVEATPTGQRLRVGYTQEYALFLHESSGWQPRPPGTKVYDQGAGQPPRIKSAWNPNATPNWLGRGLDESRPIITRIIKDNVKNDLR